MSKDKELSGAPKKVFEFFIGCAQILSTVIGVITLIISVIGLIWVVRNREAASQIVEVIAGVPTSTPIVITLPSNTPLPTYTIAPTYTPALTYTSSVVIVTATPYPPTATPSISPSSLSIGDKWSDERVSLKLVDAEFNYAPHVGLNIQHYAIGFSYEFTNHSGQDLLLRFSQNDFALTDNTEKNYDCTILKDLYLYEDINKSLAHNKAFQFWVVCGKDLRFDNGVYSVSLSVNQFSSLPPTIWIVEIPR